MSAGDPGTAGEGAAFTPRQDNVGGSETNLEGGFGSPLSFFAFLGWLRAEATN